MAWRIHFGGTNPETDGVWYQRTDGLSVAFTRGQLWSIWDGPPNPPPPMFLHGFGMGANHFTSAEEAMEYADAAFPEQKK